MKKFSLVSLACAAALVVCPAVLSAQETNFTYTFTYGAITATGTLTGSLVAAGEYNIISGTIDLTGSAIDGTGILVPIPADGVFKTGGGTNLFGFGATGFADSNLFPGEDPQINDINGVFLFALGGFNTVTGTGPGNGLAIWSYGPDSNGGFGGNWTFDIGGGASFNATAIPEGAAPPLYLLLAGTACFGAVFFRSRSGFGNHASA